MIVDYTRYQVTDNQRSELALPEKREMKRERSIL